MDDDTLRALARDLESEQVERKPSLANKDSICQAICTSANDIAGRNEPMRGIKRASPSFR